MSMLFKIIPGGIAVLNNRGVFKQVDLYEREGRIYAQWGTGYIGLRSEQGTTIPNVRWEYVEGVAKEYNKLGAMMIPAVARAA